MVTRPATKKTTAAKEPGKLDFKRGDRLAKKVIRENTEWLKEMAKR